MTETNLRADLDASEKALDAQIKACEEMLEINEKLQKDLAQAKADLGEAVDALRYVTNHYKIQTGNPHMDMCEVVTRCGKTLAKIGSKDEV